MTIEQANQYFAALPDGFASTEQLRTAFTAPVQKVQFVGVAGTAGKTVVARLLAAILHAQGIHAGLYHAGSRPLSERICIDDAPVDEGLLALTAEALSAAEALPPGRSRAGSSGQLLWRSGLHAGCGGAAGCGPCRSAARYAGVRRHLGRPGRREPLGGAPCRTGGRRHAQRQHLRHRAGAA